MIIQLKNQTELNIVGISLHCLQLILESKGEALVFPMSVGFEVGDILKVIDLHDSIFARGEVQQLLERIASNAIICDGCEAEFTNPFDSVLCPDCSKNQESKNA